MVYNDFVVYHFVWKVISRISKYAEVIQCQQKKVIKCKSTEMSCVLISKMTLAFLFDAKVMFDTGCCLQKAQHIGIKHNHAKPKVIVGKSARAASPLPLSNSRLPQRFLKNAKVMFGFISNYDCWSPLITFVGLTLDYLSVFWNTLNYVPKKSKQRNHYKP